MYTDTLILARLGEQGHHRHLAEMDISKSPQIILCPYSKENIEETRE